MENQRINEVFSDEAFVQNLFLLETPEEAQAALREKGIEVSIEELNQLRDIIFSNIDEDGELSLDALDNVAGGILRVILPAVQRAVETLLPRPPVVPLPVPRTIIKW